jgi:spermidine/putrescine-binding protein
VIKRRSRGVTRTRPSIKTTVGAAAAAAVLVSACSSTSSPAASTAASAGASANATANANCDKTINLFSWSSYHDDAWIKEYEAKTGVKINQQLITAIPDAFAKVKAQPDTFDVVLATSGFVENYVDSGLIVPVDESKIPNLATGIQGFDWRKSTTVNGTNYGIMYSWGSQPLVWNSDKVTPDPTGWSVLFDKKYAGRVSMVDDPVTQLPVIAIAAGINDPYNMSAEDFAKFKAKLQELKGQVTHVTASIQDQTTDFTGGQVDVGILYNISTWVEANKAGTHLKEIIPAEGTAGWTDNYVITKAGDAKNKCNNIVNDFINATLDPAWQGRFISTSGNNGDLSATAAKTDAAVKAGLTAEVFAKTELGLSEKDPTFFTKLKVMRRLSNLDEWLNVWNEFKLGL